MSQISLIAKYHEEGMNAKEIHARLKEIFEPDNFSYSAVTYHIRKQSWTHEEEKPKKSGGRPPNYRIDALILQALENNSNQGYRMIADSIGYHPSSVYYVLTVRLGFKSYNLRWIPHELSLIQKNTRAHLCRELIPILERAKKNGYHFILTGDESWFYYTSKNKIVWLPKGAKPGSISRVMSDAPKVMVTIFWNPHGAHVVDALEPGQSFNAEYFINKILIPITNLPDVYKAERQKQRFIVHMDNAPVHKARVTQKFIESSSIYMPRHPPYSPDIAPSDFYLFGKLKGMLRGKAFETTKDLVEWIEDAIYTIPKKELESVFGSWIERLYRVVALKGEYYSKD